MYNFEYVFGRNIKSLGNWDIFVFINLISCMLVK